MVELDTTKTIFIIDGSSFLFRAYYSMHPVHTKEGKPVQAVYGFCRMMKKLISTFDPRYMVVVWDGQSKTARHELFPAYKATRQAPPSDLGDQKELIVKFNDSIDLKQVQVSGIEADDLMFSLAHDFNQKGFKVVLVTSDKDMGQVLSEGIIMYEPFKELFITTETIQEKYSFEAEKLPFYFALVGDASDNIPGVKGIGPRGAQELVKNFDSLHDLYAHLERVPKERTRILLRASEDNAFLSEKLFLLRYYDVGLTPEDVSFSSDNWFKARQLFYDLDFKSLLKEFPAEAGIHVEREQLEKTKHEELPAPLHQFTTKAITNYQELEELCVKIAEKKLCALDTETDSIDAMQADLVGIALCYELGMGYYIPVGHKDIPNQLDKQKVIDRVRPLLEDSAIKKCMHNAKFDLHVLDHAGIKPPKELIFDTLVAASLVTPDWQRLGLKYLSEFYLHQSMLSYKDIVKKNTYKDFSYVPLDMATEYAGADAHQTLALASVLEKELQAHDQITLFYTIELPLIPILYAMEREGIILNAAVLDDINKHITHELERLQHQITELVGMTPETLNLNSPKQLEDLLFNQLKLPPHKKTAQRTGYSTDQEVLKELAKIHPVPGLIVRYRELFKLKSTYVDTLVDFVNPETGRIHTTFRQTGVATGRLASSDPNLQNIPTHTAGVDIPIRSAFQAPEGHVFLSADYSQIELRVLAYLSQDERLKQAFIEGKDIHALTAAGLFDIPVEEVTSKQRDLAKRINFSILYGLTPYGLSKELDIPVKDAQLYIEKYFAQYPGVVAWMDDVVHEAKEHGYVQTYWGRRRFIPGIYEKNKTLFDLARRVAINTKAQGTAAELMKLGMIMLDKALHENILGARMTLQIHDELLLTVPNQEVEVTQSIVRDVLQHVVNWNVPLVVTVRTGKTWYDVTK